MTQRIDSVALDNTPAGHHKRGNQWTKPLIDLYPDEMAVPFPKNRVPVT